MAIRQREVWAGNGMYGYVDVGTDIKSAAGDI